MTTTTHDVLIRLLDDASSRTRSGSYAGAAVLYCRAWFIMDKHRINAIMHNGRTLTIDQISSMTDEYNRA